MIGSSRRPPQVTVGLVREWSPGTLGSASGCASLFLAALRLPGCARLRTASETTPDPGLRRLTRRARSAARGSGRPRGAPPTPTPILAGRVLLALLALAALTSCAHLHHRRGVPIEQRPTPKQPEETGAGTTDTTATRAPAGSSAPPSGAASGSLPAPTPVESVMTPKERQAAIGRIVADTTAAGEAVRRCGSRKLLPDQESVYDTTRSLLLQTRSALLRDEVWRAESLARKARQLALSLDCP